jgi:hypothetical protein
MLPAVSTTSSRPPEAGQKAAWAADRQGSCRISDQLMTSASSAFAANDEILPTAAAFSQNFGRRSSRRVQRGRTFGRRERSHVVDGSSRRGQDLPCFVPPTQNHSGRGTAPNEVPQRSEATNSALKVEHDRVMGIQLAYRTPARLARERVCWFGSAFPPAFFLDTNTGSAH